MGTMELLHPTTGLTAVGLLLNGRPVWPVLGAEGDEDEGAAEEEGADEEGTGDADQEDGADDAAVEKPAPKKPADMVSRAELLKATAARDTAKRELREERAAIAKLKQQGEDDTAKAIREAAEEAATAAEKKYKPIALRAALLTAGVKAGRIAGAVKLLEIDDIEVDGNGEVSGLEGQLDGLREEWPELFASAEEPKREARPGSRAADGADKRPAPKKPLTPTERQALSLQGRMG